MKEEKNLDRLFQEKFKDFERLPSDAVWKNIVIAQAEKDDRKIVPIWWKLAGAAAVIALLFTSGVILFNNSPSDSLENEIVTTSDSDATNSSDPITNALPLEAEEALLPEALGKNTVADAAVIDKNNSRSTVNESANTPSLIQGNYVQNTNQKSTNNTVSNTATQNTNVASLGSLNGVAVNNSPSNKTETTPLLDEEQNKEILKNQIKTNSGVTQAGQGIEYTALPIDKTQEKVSLIDEAKRIEERKKENEAVALLEETPNTNRWDVGAVAAPVYYGDFGGSGIDPAFSDNTKSGDVNFSYGVQVSYAVSPKIKVRTGVSNVDLSYNTSGIAFTAGPDARRLSGINYNQNAQALNITDAGNIRQGDDLQDGLLSEDLNASTAINGTLQQRVGFVEIPVEAIYVVSDKRLGLQVVGGLSTLLLNNNEIILNAADGLQSNLGSANGVNDVSFTTNIGLGLDYKMTDKLKFNLEPSLKYQLNAFDQSVGDFRPYFVGLYTGVSYRF